MNERESEATENRFQTETQAHFDTVEHDSKSRLPFPLALLVGTRFLREDFAERPEAAPLQPLAGLLIGILATAVPLLCIKRYSDFQGALMLSSGIYVFLLAWLSGFANLQGFGRACAAVACRFRSMETRRAVLSGRRIAAVFAASGCTAMLVCMKFLTVYLLFAHAALLGGETILLGFVLCTTPVLARVAMLDLLPNAFNGLDSKRIVKMPVIVIWIWRVALLFVFFVFFLIFVASEAPLTLRGAIDLLSSDGIMEDLPVASAVFATIPPFAGALLPVVYWKKQTMRFFDRRGGASVPKAVCECAETTILIGFLLSIELFYL